MTYGSISGSFTSIPEETDKETVKRKRKYTTTQWLTLITLAFGNFCAGACVSLQAPFFPAEAESKGATPTEYGFIFGIFQLTIFVTAPLMGKIVTYVSPKFLLNSGILAVGVTCILFGTLDLVVDTRAFVSLAFVIRTVEGTGAAALRTSCYTIIASQFTEGIGTTFAILETFLGVGLITGPTLGGALYDLGGYGLPFYVVGSIVIVDAIIIFFVLPDFNLSGVFLGMMFALSGTIYAITAPGWGWLCDKKCNSQVLSLFGCGIQVASLLLIGPAPFFDMAPTVWIVVLSLVLMGFALGAKLVCAFTGTLQDTMNRGLPPDLSTYGLVSSMIASSQSLGAFIGPSLGGYFLDEFGFRKASMTLLILETVLIILLVVSLCTSNICTKKAGTIKYEIKKQVPNGCLPKEENIENGCLKTISN
ncbi:MFS-type transporter SLC18B1 [Trichonephila inaurata madagascariensis]|uniref:MFS-type transporter SLC18B1 n=1 Tax=Trichonephila inaurata madagascariensis TaxID=2747483 RepID=A0A8X6YIE4_9ARAC|nr:MFS-type transporter SLC18B1 [Trichonephila inaurata madagascariensis]